MVINAMKFIILDRDDTLNYDPGYLHDPKKVELKKHVIDGLKLLKNKGFKFLVISNQSGINRGYFKKEDAVRVNKKINKLLNRYDLNIERFYFCPHRPDENCSCRKPKIGLFDKALSEYGIDINHSYMIGDKKSDIMFGKNAGLKTVYLNGNKKLDVDPDFVAKNLYIAAKWIIKNEKN